MKLINKTLLWDYLLRLKFNIMSIKWEKDNRSNFTKKANNYNHKLVSVGNYSYGPIKLITYGDSAKLIIGSFVSIGPEVKFLLEVEHPINHISTYPYKARIFNIEEPIAKGNIYVEDDVWLGYGATILSGVHISQGAVIAAGAVITADVPPYAIVGGIPAKVIRYRFSEPIINYLLTIDYSKLDEPLIRKHICDLYKPIDGMELEELKKLYSWFPKKMN